MGLKIKTSMGYVLPWGQIANPEFSYAEKRVLFLTSSLISFGYFRLTPVDR